MPNRRFVGEGKAPSPDDVALRVVGVDLQHIEPKRERFCDIELAFECRMHPREALELRDAGLHQRLAEQHPLDGEPLSTAQFGELLTRRRGLKIAPIEIARQLDNALRKHASWQLP